MRNDMRTIENIRRMSYQCISISGYYKGKAHIILQTLTLHIVEPLVQQNSSLLVDTEATAVNTSENVHGKMT